ncbi:prepilin-type N-terminal cleavage/methylation domain-containing protein [bacterium]|nr:prepilin-type N-terminal cleavage/methylation domain-containing protein [bacterium]
MRSFQSANHGSLKTGSSTRGFSLIELIVVVTIMAVLTGIAVPYYQEYVVDARRSALQQNLANYRKVLFDFQGDQGRGPFRVNVSSGATQFITDPRSTNLNYGNELVGGPVQVTTTVERRRNVRYLSGLPVFNDPTTGAQLTWGYGTCTAYFVDDGDGLGNDGLPSDSTFDILVEFSFLDNNRNGQYNASDTVLYYKGLYSERYLGSAGIPLDYINVLASDSGGMFY